MEVRMQPQVTNPFLTPVRPAAPQDLTAARPADGFQPGAVQKELSRLDLVNLTAAGSVTASGLAFLAGASEGIVGALALPALVAAPIGLGAMLLRKDANVTASKTGMLARVASASVATAAVLGLAGAGTLAAVAALPAMVAAPVAVGMAAFQALKRRQAKPAPAPPTPPAPPAPAPPQQALPGIPGSALRG